MTVIDASAALGLVLPDESVDSERLQQVVSRGDLAAPGIWTFECANALSSAVRRGLIQPATAVRAADLLASLGVHVAEGVSPAALVQAALDADLSAYDAAYLDLARRTGRSLLTFDRRLAEAARGLGVELA